MHVTRFAKAALVAAVGLTAASAPDAAQAASVLSEYNLVVTGNLSSTTEVEGKTVVGGNLTGPAANFGIKLTPASAYLGTDVLTVGGDIAMQNVNMQAGNIRLGGSKGSTNLNFNGGGHLINDPALDLSSFEQRMQDEAAAFAGLTANSTIQAPTSQPGPLKFIAAPSGVENLSVFHVDAGTVFGNDKVQQLELLPNGASSVVINVSGTSVNFQHGNMVGLFTSDAWRSKIVWNFYEATSIILSRQFNGSILAPFADLTNYSDINGSIAVAGMTMRGEAHLHGYTGFTPTPDVVVPTPSAALTGLAMLGGVLLRRRAA